MEQLISKFFGEVVTAVVASVIHNWLPLVFAIVLAALMTIMINPDKLRASLIRKTRVSIWASVAFGAFTPFCACGTSAVVIAMLTTTLPWAPIMAFLTSSPLMSPDTFVMLAGIISVEFAVALTIASVIIGLGSGYITYFIEKKTSFLKDQVRLRSRREAMACGCDSDKNGVQDGCGCDSKKSKRREEPQACGCGSNIQPKITDQTQGCGCGTLAIEDENNEEDCDCGETLGLTPACCTAAGESIAPARTRFQYFNRFRLSEFKDALINIGLKQILLFYSIFVAIGYLINLLIPTDVIVALFSGNNPFAVPLASLIGLPLYVSGEGAIPLINALMKGGAGGGAMLAFMITGPGTSAWVIAGISTFMKKRAVGLYIGFLLAFAVVLGYLYDLYIMLVH